MFPQGLFEKRGLEEGSRRGCHNNAEQVHVPGAAPTQARSPKDSPPLRRRRPLLHRPRNARTTSPRLSLARPPTARLPPPTTAKPDLAPPRHSVHATDRVYCSLVRGTTAQRRPPFPRSSSGSLPLSTYVLTKGDDKVLCVVRKEWTRGAPGREGGGPPPEQRQVCTYCLCTPSTPSAPPYIIVLSLGSALLVQQHTCHATERRLTGGRVLPLI